MSPEAQRIAIAEACGWKRGKDAKGWNDARMWFKDKAAYFVEQLPDYLNDLNAMHEAEKVLTYNQCKAYIEHLSVQSHDTMRLGKAREFAENFAFHATAAQRAEAFLRTLGKWEESS